MISITLAAARTFSIGCLIFTVLYGAYSDYLDTKALREGVINNLHRNAIRITPDELSDFWNMRGSCGRDNPCLISLDADIIGNGTYAMIYREADSESAYTVYGWRRRLAGYEFFLKDNYTVLDTNYISPYTVHIGNVSQVVEKLLDCWYPAKFYGTSIDKNTCIRFSSSIIRRGFPEDTQLEVDIYKVDSRFHDAVIIREANQQIFVSSIARYREDAIANHVNREVPGIRLNIIGTAKVIVIFCLHQLLISCNMLVVLWKYTDVCFRKQRGDRDRNLDGNCDKLHAE